MEGTGISVQGAPIASRRRLRPTVALAIALAIGYVAGLLANTVGGERVGLVAVQVMGVAYLVAAAAGILIAVRRWRQGRPLGEPAVGLGLILLMFLLLPFPIAWLGQRIGLPDAVPLDGLATVILTSVWAAVSFRAVTAYVRDVREHPY